MRIVDVKISQNTEHFIQNNNLADFIAKLADPNHTFFVLSETLIDKDENNSEQDMFYCKLENKYKINPDLISELAAKFFMSSSSRWGLPQNNQNTFSIVKKWNFIEDLMKV